MTADMQRARQLAWELPKLDWEVEILCPDESYQRSPYVDNDSLLFFSPTASIHFVKAFYSAIFSTIGIGSIGWRALIPMLRAGRKLLKTRRFDLIYFSTTQFPLFLLGPIWQRWFGIPYVLDFQDPLYQESNTHPVWTKPSIKHAIANCLSKYVESWSTLSASGIISVSPNYCITLLRRYESKKPAWLGADRVAVIPFGVCSYDLEETSRSRAHEIEEAGRPVRIVYVGVGGPIMRRSFTLICRALSQARLQHPELVENIKIELYGTMLGWKEGDPCELENIAREQGVSEFVKEYPSRVTYRRSVELLLDCDGALVLGVDDVGYMPSKLFSYALSGKPLLASLHADGPAVAQLQNTPGLGHVLWFNESDEMVAADAENVMKQFLEEVVARRNFDRRAMLEPFLAATMAHRHVKLFEACLLR
jgi:hypothetical protein